MNIEVDEERYERLFQVFARSVALFAHGKSIPRAIRTAASSCDTTLTQAEHDGIVWCIAGWLTR